MIHNLRKKLTMIYTVTIGLILICVLGTILYSTEKSIDGQNTESFQKNAEAISSKLKNSKFISQSWLTEQELENQLIIHIEQNSTPFLFPGSYEADTDRDKLIEKARTQAQSHQVYTDTAPVSTSSLDTGIMHVSGSHNDSYLAYVMTAPAPKDGYKSLILLHDNKPMKQQILKGRITFLTSGILGIIAVFFVSWFFVGQSLKPLADSQKKQTGFIASASHELRSPLAVIQASASAISSDPEQSARFSGTIQKECRRMGRLVNDMLLLASTDANGWQIGEKHIDMDTLLLDVFEHFEPLCASSHILLHLSLPDTSLPHVIGDKERLEQIFTILIDNAMAYAGSGHNNGGIPSIEIRAQASRHYLSVSVADNGPGIPDDEKPLVFDRFFRSDRSHKDKSHFGLGLSIASELARLHQGSLTLSDTPSGGCTFTLRLPVPAPDSTITENVSNTVC